TSLRAQTGCCFACSLGVIHPHRRLCSKPAFRHKSHFQPAWCENWKWKATISFFVRQRKDLSRREPPRALLETTPQDRCPAKNLASRDNHQPPIRRSLSAPNVDKAYRFPRAAG